MKGLTLGYTKNSLRRHDPILLDLHKVSNLEYSTLLSSPLIYSTAKFWGGARFRTSQAAGAL